MSCCCQHMLVPERITKRTIRVHRVLMPHEMLVLAGYTSHHSRHRNGENLRLVQLMPNPCTASLCARERHDAGDFWRTLLMPAVPRAGAGI